MYADLRNKKPFHIFCVHFLISETIHLFTCSVYPCWYWTKSLFSGTGAPTYCPLPTCISNADDSCICVNYRHKEIDWLFLKLIRWCISFRLSSVSNDKSSKLLWKTILCLTQTDFGFLRLSILIRYVCISGEAVAVLTRTGTMGNRGSSSSPIFS